MTIISSGIYPIDPTITDGTQLAGYINELVEAINSNQASSTRPPMITKGGLWTKNLTGDDIAVMVYDGTNDVEIAKMQGGDLIINNENVYTKDEVDVLLEQYVEEAPEDGKQYARKDAGWIEVEATSGGGGEATGTPSSFARIVDEKPEGTAGGTSVAGGSFRELNTIQYDEDNIVTLADNSFTLQAGTYVINYSASAHMLNSHQVSLKNITDNLTVNTGTSEYTGNASDTPASVGDSRSFGRYVVTLTKPTTYKVWHYTQVEKLANGLGLSTYTSGNSNTYTTVDIEKVGTGGGSGSGTKLQVKSSKNSTRTTQTNTGVWEDTGLEVKITPASADNQVWLSFSAGLGNTSESANNSVRLVRNSDELVEYKRVSFNGAGHSNSQQSFQFLDTPNSTTELTYKLQTKTDKGELRFNDTDSGNASTSTATAIEIGDVSSGGDSIWTEVDGVAMYDGAVDLGTPELEQKLNVYNIGTSKYGFGGIPYYARMYFPSDGNLQFGTMSKDGNDTFTSLMQLSNDGNVGIGGVPANFNGTNLHVKSNNVASVLAEGNGRVTQILANETAGCVVGARSNHDLKIITNDQTRMTIGTDGSTVFYVNGDVAMEVTATKKAKFYGEVQIASLPTNGNPSNVYVNESGVLYKSTATSYTTEEVDKKLAVKDKLIEKLESRLKKIEDQLKKKK